MFCMILYRGCARWVTGILKKNFYFTLRYASLFEVLAPPRCFTYSREELKVYAYHISVLLHACNTYVYC